MMIRFLVVSCFCATFLSCDKSGIAQKRASDMVGVYFGDICVGESDSCYFPYSPFLVCDSLIAQRIFLLENRAIGRERVSIGTFERSRRKVLSEVTCYAIDRLRLSDTLSTFALPMCKAYLAGIMEHYFPLYESYQYYAENRRFSGDLLTANLNGRQIEFLFLTNGRILSYDSTATNIVMGSWSRDRNDRFELLFADDQLFSGDIESVLIERDNNERIANVFLQGAVSDSMLSTCLRVARFGSKEQIVSIVKNDKLLHRCL